MSVAQPPTPPVPPPPAPPRPANKNEIVIYSHSNLFYWWPVWAVGFLMAILTLVEDRYMVVVPRGTKAIPDVTVTHREGPKKTEERAAYVLPEGRELPKFNPERSDSPPADPEVHVTGKRGYGVLFCMVLVLVVVITNVPLRGMWSILVIVSIVMLSLVFHLLGWWEDILRRLSLLDIRINLGGYLFLATVLFGIWLFTLMFFDRQIYMIFTPGQLKVCTEIGGGEKVYDAMGMAVEKQRSDIFRHWILGLGSGDLIVKTSGAQAHTFDLPNVLFISKKVQQIEDLLKKRAVVESR